jgi:hypothetical protein
MFKIDTGDTGSSLGPWITWSSNGSAEKAIPPRSWVLRDKDDHGGKVETAIPAFANGCIMDIDSLKIGWERDGAPGQAPERRWNPSISQATPRPDESKKPGSNSYAWSRALSVRLAIGGGKAATWEQGSFGAMKAFDALAGQIQAEWAQHSQNGRLLPHVVQESVEKIMLKSGAANIPVLRIKGWVERPDCLKDSAPTINTGAAQDAPAPASVAGLVNTPAPAPAPQAAPIPADAEF